MGVFARTVQPGVGRPSLIPRRAIYAPPIRIRRSPGRRQRRIVLPAERTRSRIQARPLVLV